MLRLARSAEVDQYILRGGMLLRHWFRPFDRPAADVDLVSRSQFNLQVIERQLVAWMFDDRVDDGVIFNSQRYRVQGIWLDTDFPGVRMFAFGCVNGVEQPIHIDVTFGESLTPEPELGDYPITGQSPARIWMCRPEAIAGRKLHALCDMGMRHWRPKDLNDIQLLLRRTVINANDLAAGITYSFNSRGDSATKARTLFSSESWWSTKTASARWDDFTTNSCHSLSTELATVVAEVGERLTPILKRLR